MKGRARDFAGFINESREPGAVNARLRQAVDRLPKEALDLLDDAIGENPADILHIADSVLNGWADSEEDLQRREYESGWDWLGRENYLRLRSRFEDLSPETLRQVFELLRYAYDEHAFDKVGFILTRKRMKDRQADPDGEGPRREGGSRFYDMPESRSSQVSEGPSRLGILLRRLRQ